MIEELKPLPIIDEYGNTYGESAPTMWKMMDKINEIIRYLNKKEDEKTNHDYAHCDGNGCSIREKCKRYLLHLEAVKKGMMLYVSYIKPGRKGNECKFYLEEER